MGNSGECWGSGHERIEDENKIKIKLRKGRAGNKSELID